MPIATILEFIAGPWGRVVSIGITVLILVLGFFAWLKIHDHNLRIQATTDFNKKQIEQTIEDLGKLNAKLQTLNETANKMAEELTSKNQAIDDIAAKIKAQNTVKGGKDQAPDYTKETVRQLQKRLP